MLNISEIQNDGWCMQVSVHRKESTKYFKLAANNWEIFITMIMNKYLLFENFIYFHEIAWTTLICKYFRFLV